MRWPICNRSTPSPSCGDAPDDLMAGNERRFVQRKIAFDDVNVRAANCACGDPNDDVAGRRRGHRQFAQRERLSGGRQDHCSHEDVLRQKMSPRQSDEFPSAMNVAVFSSKAYDREFLEAANNGRHTLRFFEPHLNLETAPLAAGFEAVCVFVNDHLEAAVIERLAAGGTRLLALRCAGYNNVDLSAAAAHGLTVVRVPGYSPHAVAEHTIGLILALNRNLHRAYNRVREGNFALDGLLGFDLHGRTAGLVGTGKIGTVVAQILTGIGCRVLAFDPLSERAMPLVRRALHRDG